MNVCVFSDPTISDTISNIPIQDLPSCEKCGSLVRPHIVWFGENLEEEVLQQCCRTIHN